jgi:carboxymethylenebutenolidase
MGKDITYTTRAGENFTGYLAEPDGNGSASGILLISAIWGNDESILQLTDAWAADGFIVSVPDIFWRQTPGPTADRDIAVARYEAFDVDQGMLDIEDLINNLKDHPRCNGKIAVLGFCFGGRYAHLCAARLGIGAAASFHGTYIEKHLDEAANVTCPVSYHFGEDDPVVPMDQVAAIREAYAGNSKAEVVAHPGATHNFSMPLKPDYHAAVAESSRDTVLRCFQSM